MKAAGESSLRAWLSRSFPVFEGEINMTRTCFGSVLRGFTVLAVGFGSLGLPSASSAQGQSDFLYVANQAAATISIIDVTSNEVTETIDLQELGFSANAKPHYIVVEPDGSFWYVSLIAENTVVKFDRANQMVGQASFEAPGLMVLHPGNGLLYVGRSMAATNPPERIGVIDRGSMSIDEVDVFYPRPHALALNESGGQVYSASLGVNQVASVDVRTDFVNLTSLSGEQHAIVQFAVSPDGRTMVGTTQLTGKVLVFDLAAPNRPELVRSVSVGAQPWHPIFTPDGRLVYVGNKMANTVTVLDARRGRVVEVIEGEGIAQPHGAVTSPDGRWVYVSNNNTNGDYVSASGAVVGTVVVIDLETAEVVKVIEVGAGAAGLGIRSAH